MDKSESLGDYDKTGAGTAHNHGSMFHVLHGLVSALEECTAHSVDCCTAVEMAKCAACNDAIKAACLACLECCTVTPQHAAKK